MRPSSSTHESRQALRAASFPRQGRGSQSFEMTRRPRHRRNRACEGRAICLLILAVSPCLAQSPQASTEVTTLISQAPPARRRSITTIHRRSPWSPLQRDSRRAKAAAAGCRGGADARQRFVRTSTRPTRNSPSVHVRRHQSNRRRPRHRLGKGDPQNL